MIQKTPFYSNHVSLGAKMVDYAGFSMPIYYNGINIEHNHVRKSVGIFDVSHMGQLIVEGLNVLQFLQKITTNNVSKLTIGKVQYSCITNENGGILDDLLVYKLSEEKYMLVVNASNTEKIIAWMRKHNNFNLKITNITKNRGLLALQGPKALSLLQKITEYDLKKISYYSFDFIDLLEEKGILVSATGYTGAGGFEIYADKGSINKIWEALFKVKDSGLLPIGLGARDTLRMEMGYCLYGNEINELTTPLEAGLSWIVDLNKDFIGSRILKKNKLSKKIIAFELKERGIARTGYDLVNDKNEKIGYVSSGTMSPYLNKSIGIGFIYTNSLCDNFFILIRNRKIKAKLAQFPFLKNN